MDVKEDVDSFTYLLSIMMTTGENDKDITIINKACHAFAVLKSTQITIRTKLRMFNRNIKFVLYGAKC